MSLSMQALDFYDDLKRTQLKQIADTAPSFIKSASLSTREQVSKLPTELFALHALTKEGTHLRKYPVNSAADTWLSCAYFEKNAHKLPSQAAKITATHLKIACEKFQLNAPKEVERISVDETPLSNLYVEENDLEKNATIAGLERRPDNGSYALPGRYPLFNQEFVKKASQYFVTHFADFEPDTRYTFAKNTLAKASELGMSLDVNDEFLLRKVAGDTYGTKIDSQLRIRANIVDGISQLEEKLSKVAAAKESLPAEKFAQLLQAFDNEAGVSRIYGGNVLDAYQATFDKDMDKTASTVWEDETTGLTLSSAELEKAANDKSDKIKAYFGETMANSLKKHSHDIFQSLPSDAKAMIAKIAKGSL
jgi:hypothetical protein